MNLCKILPLCSLMFFVACGDESSSFVAPANATNPETELSSSTTSSASSSSAKAPMSSSLTSSATLSSAKVVTSSSSARSTTSSSWSAAIGSSSSRHSGPDPESSSVVSISSSSFQNDESSSSVAASSSSAINPASSFTVIPASSGNLPSSSSTISTTLSSSARFTTLSSSTPIEDLSSSSSRHSGLDPESSSSATLVVSSSSEAASDPTKIFNIRVPDQKFLPCHDSIVSGNYREDWIDTVAQSDLICSFKYDGDSGFVYVQNNPVSCRLTVGLISYEVHKAEFFVNGSMREILDAKYHGGGNHRIFGLQFTYKGKVFKYDYSTMGMGGRPCQNMDCMKVLESDGKTVVQNGCDEDRSLPIVCRHAKVNGTFDSFEDSFHVCKSGVFVD